MDEIGKGLVSIAMMVLGAFLIALSFILGFNDMIVWFVFGIALSCFGVFIFYLRHVSIKSQSRVKKATITRVIREVPKPKPKPVQAAPAEEKPKRPEILCDTCEFYFDSRARQKCKFISDQERMAMINAGIECVEYKIRLTMLD